MFMNPPANGQTVNATFNKQNHCTTSGTEAFGATDLTGSGTKTFPAVAVSPLVATYLSRERAASLTGANSLASFRHTSNNDAVYANATCAAAAGFLYQSRIAVGPVILSDMRFFFGLSPNAAPAGTVDPSSLLNSIIIGKDSADSLLYLMHNDGAGTATKIATPFTFAAGRTYDLYLSVPRGGGSCSVTLIDVDSSLEFTAAINTDLPATDIPILFQLWSSNGPTGGVAATVEWMFVDIQGSLLIL